MLPKSPTRRQAVRYVARQGTIGQPRQKHPLIHVRPCLKKSYNEISGDFSVKAHENCLLAQHPPRRTACFSNTRRVPELCLRSRVIHRLEHGLSARLLGNHFQ